MIERVAVVGGGFMGSGIAECVARAGIPVVVSELDAAAAGRARERIEESTLAAVGRGRLSPAERERALALVATTGEIGAIAEAQLVVEAVPEELALKREVIRSVAAAVGPEAVIASNTSSIPLAELAGSARVPERVLGLHFFSPVPAMKLVEIVRALDTSDRTVAAAREFCEAIGKTAIETKDRSGFIVNMLLVPYLMAAVRMFEEGFAPRRTSTRGCASAAAIRSARSRFAT